MPRNCGTSGSPPCKLWCAAHNRCACGIPACACAQLLPCKRAQTLFVSGFVGSCSTCLQAKICKKASIHSTKSARHSGVTHSMPGRRIVSPHRSQENTHLQTQNMGFMRHGIINNLLNLLTDTLCPRAAEVAGVHLSLAKYSGMTLASTTIELRN